MSVGRFFTGVVIGAAIGAVAGILLAPQSGEETREKIGAMAKDTAEKTENYKGGRQTNLNIKFETGAEIYKIIGNTSSQKMADFYSKIKSEIIKIIEQ